MVGSVKDLFLHPDAFFAQVSREKAGFFWPFIVVFLGSVISFIGAVVLSPPVTDPVTQYSITFLSQFAGAFVTWIIISTGLYLLSRAFSGTGSFLITFQNTGFGMLPFAFSAALTFISIALITGNAASLSSVPPTVFFIIVYAERLVFTIWTAYLWVCGVRNAHKLPTPLAAAVVVMMVAISFAVYVVLTTMLFQ